MISDGDINGDKANKTQRVARNRTVVVTSSARIAIALVL